jgi:oligopeptide/dipeptide ABC transporter ATP-binding protein
MAATSGKVYTLEIEDLSIDFPAPGGTARVVDHVSLTVGKAEIVGLIGESGSGKTLTALSVLGMLPVRARIASGTIRFSAESVLDKSERERRAIRGDRIALIPQDALRALNPTLQVGVQVGEPLTLHRRRPWTAAKLKAIELLGAVHLREPARRAQEYPHQFSGGMQQRAMIAMGISLSPELLIADEPTTALDVTVQAQVIQLLREIREIHHVSILFITHDLGVVADLCDRVYVMYAGAVVERGPTDRIFERPSHPYTQALLRSTPTVHGPRSALAPIPGQIPLPTERPEGCRFADRCALALPACRYPPPSVEVEEGHVAECVLAGQMDSVS